MASTTGGRETIPGAMVKTVVQLLLLLQLPLLLLMLLLRLML